MELTQLKQFKAVAETGNMSKAAEMLFVSQSTLSKSIRKLEEEIGAELFIHTKNRIILNDNGTVVLERVYNILKEIEKIEYDINALKKNDNSICFASSSIPALRFIVPMFYFDSPLITLSSKLVEQSDLKDSLLEKEADIAIGMEYIEHEDIQSLKIGEDRLFIAVPLNHPLARKKSVQFEDVAPYEFIRCSDRDYMSEKISKRIKKIKGPVQADYQMFLQILRTTDYPYFTSLLAKKYAPNASTRKFIPVDEPCAKFTLYFSCLHTGLKKTNSFFEWLKANAVNVFS